MQALLVLSALLSAPSPNAGRPILITVDDLPITSGVLGTPKERKRVTDRMLAQLARHRIKAVGFVTQKRIMHPSDRGLLKAWLAAGHELGNHSDGHLNYSASSIETYIADIERGRAGVEALTGKVRWFRFPFLREGNNLEKLRAARAYLKKTKQRNVPVTIDTQDWAFEKRWVEAERARDQKMLDQLAQEYQTMLRMAVRHYVRRGDRLFKRPVPQVILLHAGAVGAAQWGVFFDWLKAQGYRFASSDEVLSDKAFSAPHEFVGEKGYSLWDRHGVQRRAKRVKSELRALLARQAKDWNRGDLEAFCSVYAHDATFISPSGRSSGRDRILARYQKKYRTAAQRGILKLEVEQVQLFEGYEVSRFGDAVPSKVHGAAVALKWTIQRKKERLGGRSLITLKPDGKRWLIVQDASM